MVVQLTVSTNSLAFFGKELGNHTHYPTYLVSSSWHFEASNTEFMKSALDFIEHTLMTAELVRLLPQVLAQWDLRLSCKPYSKSDMTSRPIGQLLASRLSSHQVIYEHLVPIAEQRLLEQSQANMGQSVPKHVSIFTDIPSWNSSLVNVLFSMIASNIYWRLRPRSSPGRPEESFMSLWPFGLVQYMLYPQLWLLLFTIYVYILNT